MSSEPAPDTSTMRATRATRPLVSLVVSVYGVEDYIEAFLDSVDELDFDHDRLELIFVDDGTKDRSADLVAAWMEKGTTPARLLHKPNGGLSSARNYGMAEASGEWISFPDPDDVLSVDYLTEVARFLDSERSAPVSMVAARLIQFVDDPAQPIARHPLDFKFDRRERVVDLTTTPRFVHLHSATGFYRLDAIRDNSLTFNEQVTPVFEDGVFTGHYLLTFDRPVMAFLGEAKYYYRKRENMSSLTGTSWGKAGRFDDVLRHGHLGLLEHAGEKAPKWLQHILLYDLQWYPKADERNVSETAALTDDQLARFDDLYGRTLAGIDDDVIMQYSASGLAQRYRLALLARKNGALPLQDVYVAKVDRAQEIQLLRYFSADPKADEVLRVDGVETQPVFAKTTAMVYYGSPWLYQRDLWVTALEPVSLEVDGVRRRIILGNPSVPMFETMPATVWDRFLKQAPPDQPDWNAPRIGADEAADLTADRIEPTTAPAEPPREAAASTRTSSANRLPAGVERVRTLVRDPERLRNAVRRRLPEPLAKRVSAGPNGEEPRPHSPEERAARVVASARGRANRRKFRRAWVLIDRDSAAQDNAEAFYRYLMRERPDVNAWFVLNDDSPDWDRLTRDGFRLVAHGTDEHVILMLNARLLISSQMDEYIVKPYDRELYEPGNWKFVALQHGVGHHDLSRWLNAKPIRLWTTSTQHEHDGIVRDGSPYHYSEKEVVLTGMPRHDTLLAKAQALPDSARNTIVLMPTWRDHLLAAPTSGHVRELRTDFDESYYARNWFGLARSGELAAAAEHSGCEIVFMAHPNLQHIVTQDHVGPHVRLARYADNDVQEIIARARVLVTDYSSTAFEAAFVGTPVVYFQFDRADFYSGLHPFRRYDFSHIEHGFGPVVDTVEEAARAIGQLADAEVPEPYRTRIDQAFPFRDGQSSARVYEAIMAQQRSRVRDRS